MLLPLVGVLLMLRRGQYVVLLNMLVGWYCKVDTELLVTSTAAREH